MEYLPFPYAVEVTAMRVMDEHNNRTPSFTSKNGPDKLN